MTTRRRASLVVGLVCRCHSQISLAPMMETALRVPIRAPTPVPPKLPVPVQSDVVSYGLALSVWLDAASSRWLLSGEL